MAEHLKQCRRIIISNENLPLLGTRYSYVDYEEFFEKAFAPLEISDEELLTIPETIEQKQEEPAEEEEPQDEGGDDFGDDLFFEDTNNESDRGGFDFDEDFYR